MYASSLPSFPRGNSYIDLCMIDARLNIKKENISLNCLKTIDYDSDHNAIEIILSMDELENPFTFFKNIPELKYNFKKTNWKKFNSNLLRELDTFDTIPNNRNLTNSEIDNYIQRLNNFIINSINKSVPKFNNNNPVTNFVNPIIR